MPNYVVKVHSRSVFPALIRDTGETVEADNGDIVALHPSVDELVIGGFVAAGQLEATSKKATEWRTPPAPTDDAVAAVAELVKEATTVQDPT